MKWIKSWKCSEIKIWICRRTGIDVTVQTWKRSSPGNIYDVAEVVSGLSQRDREKGLSTGERKMLENAKNILYSELALVEDLDEEQVQSMVEDCLN